MKKVLKFATIYNLISTAKLKQNMAIRIMHTLIPTLIQDTATLSEQNDISGFLAQDLIPGAKEIYRYGAKAIANEYDFANDDNKIKLIQDTINGGDFEAGINLAIAGFEKDFNKTEYFGGKNWRVFAEVLKKIGEQIKKVERTGSKSEAVLLSSYLNAIDSLSHNSGSFMEKFVEEEGVEVKDLVNQKKNLDELLKLRDVTTLQNTEDVITLLQQNPEFINSLPAGYRQYLKEYRSLHPLQEGESERARDNFNEEQRKKKELEEAEQEKKWKDVVKGKTWKDALNDY